MMITLKTRGDSLRARQIYVCRAQEKFDCDSTSRVRVATNAPRLAMRFAAHVRRMRAIVAASMRPRSTLTSNA